MKKTIYFTSMVTSIILLAGCGQGWNNVFSAFKDSDGDGWYNKANNQRVILRVSDVGCLSVGGGGVITDPRGINLVIDDQTIASPRIILNPANEASVRCLGNWGGVPGSGDISFSSEVKIFKRSTEDAEIHHITWFNKDSTMTYEIDNCTLTCRTEVQRFADPDSLSDSDTDNDGIMDSEEAILAKFHEKIGDPTKQGALILTGFTHPKWEIENQTIEELTTVFAGRNIFLSFVKGETHIDSLIPGQVLTPQVDATISLEEVRSMRSDHIPQSLSSFTHFLVLGKHISSALGGDNSGYGVADMAGLNLVVRSRFGILAPNTSGYQKITVMHELGHNFSLCHPTENCRFGNLPPNEQDPGLTAMGSPAESSGLDVLIKAFERPLDYTGTQWTNLSLSGSRR